MNSKSSYLYNFNDYLFCSISLSKQQSTYTYRFYTSDNVTLFEFHSDSLLKSRFIKLILSIIYYGN